MSIDDLLKKANMNSLELMGEKIVITDVYKCINGISPI